MSEKSAYFIPTSVRMVCFTSRTVYALPVSLELKGRKISPCGQGVLPSAASISGTCSGVAERRTQICIDQLLY
jgi:hypothetical protein